MKKLNGEMVTLDQIWESERKRQQTASETSSPETSLTDEQFEGYMARLWVVMTETFGHKWISTMGEEPNPTWRQALREMTPDQWLAGISVLNRSTAEWPPSLPEFRRWCIGGMTKQQLKARANALAKANLDAQVAKYNPNGTPMTNAQYEREQDRLSLSYYVMEEENERRLALGLLEIDDPLRICQDEEYR